AAVDHSARVGNRCLHRTHDPEHGSTEDEREQRLRPARERLDTLHRGLLPVVSFGSPISRRPQKPPKDNPYKRVVYAPSRPLSTALLGPEQAELTRPARQSSRTRARRTSGSRRQAEALAGRRGAPAIPPPARPRPLRTPRRSRPEPKRAAPGVPQTCPKRPGTALRSYAGRCSGGR